MAYSSSLADRRDGQSTFPKPSSPHSSLKPFAKLFYNRHPLPSGQTHMHPNTPKIPATSRALPSQVSVPIKCYRTFRASALHTLHKRVTAAEYRYQHENVTSASEPSPPLQALLQVLDAIQPATIWAAEEKPQHHRLYTDGRGLQPPSPSIHAQYPLSHPPGRP